MGKLEYNVTGLDRARLEEISRGDALFRAELIAMFLATAMECLQDIEDSCDNELRKAQLHKLKGAALTIGAKRLGALCSDGTVSVKMLRQELGDLKEKLESI